MTAKKWEEVTVDPKGAGHTYRLRVPGGFLYRTTTYRYPEKHAQWDLGLRQNGNDVTKTMEKVLASPVRNGFDREWATQAQEIATQTTVFVPKAEKTREQKLAKAAAKVRKTYQDYFNGLEPSTRKIGGHEGKVVGSDEYKRWYPDGGMWGCV